MQSASRGIGPASRCKAALKAASHYYGCRSREAMGLSGHTLLRVQRNGLKIHSRYNIGIGAFGRVRCEASKGQAQCQNRCP
jgi:hypothetical protein